MQDLSHSLHSKYSINHVDDVSSELSFTIKKTKDWCVFLLVGLWLVFGGLAVIIITVWWSIDNNWKAYYLKAYYYTILIAFTLTIFIICISFIAQYFILPAGLPKIWSEVHKQKVPMTKHNMLKEKLANGDDIGEPMLREKKLKRNIRKCCTRLSLVISALMTAEWTLFNMISICVTLFHLCCVTLMARYIITDGFETSILLQVLYHAIRSICDVLPGVCLLLYWKAKESYQPYAKYIEKYEKKILSVSNNKGNGLRAKSEECDFYSNSATTAKMANQYIFKAHTKTLAATNSLFSYTFIRGWLLCAMLLSLLYFLLQPVVQNELFQQICDIFQNPWVDPSHFVIIMCVLRPFIGIVLCRSIFLTISVKAPRLNSKLDATKCLLSTTIIAITVFVQWVDWFFWNDDMTHLTLNIIWSAIYVCAFIHSIWVLKGLITLSADAKRDFDMFTGYNTKPSWISWSEGLTILIIYGLYFAFALTSGESVHSHIREMCLMLFNIIQLAILYPLRTIEASEKIREYVSHKKKKYIKAFKRFSVLNIIAFFYSFIFVSNTFSDLAKQGCDETNYKEVLNLLSFTFSFCMSYYPLWAIEQFDKWLKFNLEYQINFEETHSNQTNIRKDTSNSNKASFSKKKKIKKSKGLLSDNDDIKVESRDRNESVHSVASVQDSKNKSIFKKKIQKANVSNKFRAVSEPNESLFGSPNNSVSLNYSETMKQYKAKGDIAVNAIKESVSDC
eukprot:337198_1